MAPVVRALREARWAEARVLTTGQHRELVDDQLAFFEITPDRALDAMRPGGGLAARTAALLEALDDALAAEHPDLVLAQGDTTTVLAAALACCYRRVPFGHVEAGLPHRRPRRAVPEEANRLLADRIAALYFAPTQQAKDNLQREGVTERVFVTGNTVIDALLWTARGWGSKATLRAGKSAASWSRRTDARTSAKASPASCARCGA